MRRRQSSGNVRLTRGRKEAGGLAEAEARLGGAALSRQLAA
jgi:hypothetical protein